MAQYEAALQVDPSQQLHRFEDAARHYRQVTETSRYYLLVRTNLGDIDLFGQEFGRGWDA